MSNLSNKLLLDKEGVSTLIELIKRKTDNVATVAITGDYNDLENKPVIPTVPTRVSAFVNDIGYLNSESDPTFRSHVAYNIQQDDIDNWNNKQDILESGTNIKTINNLPILGEGNINISSAGELNTNNSDSLNVPNEPESLAGTINLHKVSKTGSYEDLNNKPTIPTNVSSLNNDAGYLQSETDPTVPNHVKSITLSDISNWNSKTDNVGTITGITMNGASKGTSGVVDLGTVVTTETDPTVPSWAKQSTKPSYDYSEINNTPTIPTVPTNVSAFTNDAGYITSHQDISGKQDALTPGNGITIDNSDTIRTIGIPYGVVDSTSTSKVFTATVPGIDRLENGVCVMLKNGVVTSAAGFTININGLGAKPAFNNMTAATRETTIFNINYTMLFVYDATRVVDSITGAWVCYRGYDANTNTIGYQLRTNSTVMTVTDTARYYKIYFTSADGAHWVPASVNSTNNATSARAVNQRPINPFGRIVFTSANSNYAAGANLAATTIWDQYTLTLGYSFNRTDAALTLTTNTPVYVKCAPQTNGSAIMDADTPIVQALPTTNDGKIYIFLGVAYNATSIELLNNHPVYYHDGNGIRLWTGKETSCVAFGLPQNMLPSSFSNGTVSVPFQNLYRIVSSQPYTVDTNTDISTWLAKNNSTPYKIVIYNSDYTDFLVGKMQQSGIAMDLTFSDLNGVQWFYYVSNSTLTKRDVYTKSEIDTMIGNIEILLQSI